MLCATTFTELHSMKTFQHVNDVNTKEQNRIVVYCHCNNLQGPTKKGKSKEFVQKWHNLCIGLSHWREFLHAKHFFKCSLVSLWFPPTALRFLFRNYSWPPPALIEMLRSEHRKYAEKVFYKANIKSEHKHGSLKVKKKTIYLKIQL